MKKSPYGSMQSGRNWAEHLNASLGALGWVRSRADPAICICTTSTGTSIIAVYTDDIDGISTTEAAAEDAPLQSSTHASFISPFRSRPLSDISDTFRRPATICIYVSLYSIWLFSICTLAFLFTIWKIDYGPVHVHHICIIYLFPM
jgi:hypothetical protein